MKIRTFLLASIGMFFGTLILLGFDLDDSFAETVFSYVLLGFFPIIWIHWQLRKQEKDFSDVIQTTDLRIHIPHMTGMFIVLFLFSLGAVWLNSFLLSFPFPHYVEMFLQMDDVFPEKTILYILMFIHISFIGPIAEELIFRGLILKRLAEKTNMTKAIFISSALFGIFHFDLIGSFIFGLMMALLYLHTNNLLFPIIVHSANNLLVSLLVVFNVPMPNFFSYETVSEVYQASLPNIVLLVIMTPLLIVFMLKYRKNSPM